jgi:lipopolysaccharide transport system ATP-binding protein
VTKNIAIRAEGLSKRYQLGAGANNHDSLRDMISGGIQTLFSRRGGQPARSDFLALKDASFEIAQGENVGIIGSNGAGKSTLLKILSRITEPTSGRAVIRGRVGALLEVGTGFHQELTGRENIFLYGAILGMKRREITQKFDAIVDFAEIEQFIDTPVKRYSSGMYVRLAFAVAAHLRPDILLVDEVLAVGDVAFQRKCMEFARDLQKQNATILFVSHNMFSIKAMCDRVIYVRSGTIEYDGPTDAGIETYERNAHLSIVPWSKDNPEDWPIILSDIELAGENGAPKTVLDFGERATVRLRYEARTPVEAPNFIVAFVRSDGVGCTVYTSESDGVTFDEVSGKGIVELRTPPLKLTAEKYTIHVLIRQQRRNGTEKLLCAQVGRAFHIRHTLFDTRFGVFHEAATWRSVLESETTSAGDVRGLDGRDHQQAVGGVS